MFYHNITIIFNSEFNFDHNHPYSEIIHQKPFQTTAHCIIAVSFPPVEIKRESSCRNVTAVT